jgi:hypothetical protein
VKVTADRIRLGQVYDSISFTTRKESGHRHFMTAEDIQNRQTNQTPELVHGMPGVRLQLDHNNVLRVYSDAAAVHSRVMAPVPRISSTADSSGTVDPCTPWTR